MNASLIVAFPERLAPLASRLATLVDHQTGLATSEPFTVTCDGETIQIPHRIYGPVISDDSFASLQPVERLIAACRFTRHHDGHIRERFLRTLPAFDSAWVVAYVV